MTFQEINDILRDVLNDRTPSLAYLSYDAIVNEYPRLQRLGRVNLTVHREGGEDECNGKVTIVHHFVDHDVYVRIDGFYQSHYGTGFYDWETSVHETRPVQKTLTFYE